MKSKLYASLAAVVCVLGLAGPAGAQGAKRTTVAVMDFDYGTVNHWWGQYDIGKGMADQVVDELVNNGTFRVIERKKLDTVLAEQDFAASDRADPSAAKLAKIGKVLGVKYIISGSITKFGGEEKNYGAAGLGGGKIGGLGLKKAKTYVTLTARMIDGGIKVGGAGGGGGAGFSMGSSDYKDSAIGEAQEQACKLLVEAIIAKKDRLE
jgi:curli biogenesis system outer membrane secretion channel CsgG